jgi:hypothetical protein
LGATYLQLASFAGDDAVERSDLLVKSRAAYEHALALNSEYVRSMNGLASALFQIARPLAGEINVEAPCAWKWDLIDAAEELYQKAMDAPANVKPPSGHVDFYARSGLGRVRYWSGACRHTTSEGTFAEWETARTHYQFVLDEYAKMTAPLPLLKNIAGYGHADLGMMAFVQAGVLAMEDPNNQEVKTLLTEGINEFTVAVDLGLQSNTEAGRIHVRAVMPFYLTALCVDGQGEKAVAVLGEVIQQLPDAENVRTAIIKDTPMWEECAHEKG